MTVYTQRFEITWVIRSMLGQFEYMVTMTLDIFNRGIALLADSAVTLKYKLLERKPQVRWNPAVPRKAQSGQFIYGESCHALPCLTSPNQVPTDITRHNLIRTHRALTAEELYRHALPRLSWTHPTSPNITRTRQHHTRPYIVKPSPIRHHLSGRNLTPTTSLILVNLEADYIESAKARTIVANTDSLASVDQDVLKQSMIDFVINHADFKTQLPTGCECGPDANDAITLYDNGTHIEIERLISIGVKFLRDCEAFMRDSFRVNEHIRLKQILIGLAPLAYHLEGYRRLDQCAFNVAGWLEDLSRSISVKVFAPFLRVVFRSGGFVSALAHRLKFGQRVAMLDQRGNAFNLATDGIHGILLSTVKHKAVALRSPYSCHGTRSLRKATAVCWRIKNAESRDSSIIALYQV